MLTRIFNQFGSAVSTSTFEKMKSSPKYKPATRVEVSEAMRLFRKNNPPKQREPKETVYI